MNKQEKIKVSVPIYEWSTGRMIVECTREEFENEDFFEQLVADKYEEEVYISWKDGATDFYPENAEIINDEEE